MYVVVSKWEFDPAHEAEVKSSAAKMMETIQSWPEVSFAYNVRAGANYVLAIIGYLDQAGYERLVQTPGGPFEQAAAQHQIEKYATWVWSERGPMEVG